MNQIKHLFVHCGKGLFLIAILAFGDLVLGVPTPVLGQMLPEEQSSFDLAQRLLKDGSYANAAQEYRRFILNFPTSDRLSTARFRLGEAYFQNGDLSEAVNALQAFLDGYPNHLGRATAMRRKAEALQQMEEYKEAGEAFQAVHDAFSGGEYAHQDLLLAGRNFHRADDLEAAETCFRSLISRYPGSALLHETTYQLGLVLLSGTRHDEALREFAAVADGTGKSEREPDALLQMGRLALTRHDLEQAEATFTRLRSGFPGSHSAEASFLETASWHASREDWAQASRAYQSAREALPRGEAREQAVLGLAGARMELGDPSAARSLYEQFLKVYKGSPRLPAAWLGLGRAYARQGQHRDGLRAFQRLIEHFPSDSVSTIVLYDIGDSWREVGMPRKALSSYRACAQRVADQRMKASVELQIADVYESDLNWHDRAIQSYGRLIEGPYRDLAASAQFGLARTFERTGQTVLALREYQAYLQSYPGGAQAVDSETRIRYLKEFGTGKASGEAEVANLLASLPEVRRSPESVAKIGEYHFAHRNYEAASLRLREALTYEVLTRPGQTGLLLGQSELKLALKAELSGDSIAALAHREAGVEALQAVLAEHPDSPWADDASVALVEEQVQDAPSDSVLTRRLLAAYGEFRLQHPDSDRLPFALLRTADAHRVSAAADTGHLRKAEEGYRELLRLYPEAGYADQATFGLGACQAIKRDYIDAEETLRSFLFDFPGSDLVHDVRFELGRILMAREYYRSAAEEFSELLAAPSSLRLERTARARLAECYFRAGDYHSAIEVDELLLRRGPDKAAMRRLGRAYQQSGRADLAVEVYAGFLRNFPNAADADSIALSRADLLAYMGRAAEALSAFQGLPKRYPDSPLTAASSAKAADIQFGLEDFAGALAGYRRVPGNRQSADVAGREVLCLFNLGRLDEARKSAKAFGKRFKQDVSWKARFDVAEGKHAMGAGSYKRARSRFEAVVKNAADVQVVSEADYYLTQVVGKEGKKEDHLKTLLEFVKRRPASDHWADASIELAGLYEAEADYAAASKFYRQAMEAGVPLQRRPGLLTKLVTVHRNLRLFDTAIAYAKILVEEFPREVQAAQARVDIGLMYFDARNYQEAIRELVPQLKLARGNDWSILQYHIAESYLLMNDLDSAQREFLRLQYENKGIADWLANAHDGLAKCYIAQSRYSDAIQELEEIIRRFGPSSAFGLQAGETVRQLKQIQVNESPRNSDRR